VSRRRHACRVLVLEGLLCAAHTLWPLSAGSAESEGQSCDTSAYPLSSPTSRFEDHGDGTVTDRQSKLMWMRCSIGQVWSAGTCTGKPRAVSRAAADAEAIAVNKSGRFFFSDWRVPELPELAGITERQCKNPRVNLAIFPTTPPEFYWSATSRKADPAGAFALSFGPEGVTYSPKEQSFDVRLVRTAP
jgi:hypothetical protein